MLKITTDNLRKNYKRLELVVENLEKGFDGKHVLTGAGLVFEQGKIYGLLGRNGAGKTTLFNCLSGELQADRGRMKLLEGHSSRDLQAEDVGYVHSLPMLPEFLTGYEFIRFYTDVNQAAIADQGDDIDALFNLMSIEESDRHKLIKYYSHGMKNKLQMLLVLLMRPPVILLDEPLTSLDVVVALEMKQLLRKMKDDHVLIFSTHILQLAADLCDELIVLHRGKLTRVSAEVLKQPDFEQQVIELLSEDDAGDPESGEVGAHAGDA